MIKGPPPKFHGTRDNLVRVFGAEWQTGITSRQ